jgi:hypothetical protein
VPIYCSTRADNPVAIPISPPEIRYDRVTMQLPAKLSHAELFAATIRQARNYQNLAGTYFAGTPSDKQFCK